MSRPRARTSLLAPLLAAALLLPGCIGDGGDPQEPTPEPRFVEPPQDGGGFASCGSPSAQQLALGFTSESTRDAEGFPPGVHRLDARTFLYVWARHEDSLREDRVSRVNEVQAFQEPGGPLVLCSRVEIAAPLEVDDEPETYDVAVRYVSHGRLPDGPLRLVVNWVAGCGACGVTPKGNATADFA